MKQLGTGVQGLQRLTSAAAASVHVPAPDESVDPSHTYSPPIACERPRIAGNVQQPKQSQPLGVIGLQESRHCRGWVIGHVIPPTALLSYGHVGPSGGKFGATDNGSQR